MSSRLRAVSGKAGTVWCAASWRGKRRGDEQLQGSHRRRRTTAAERAQILATFERSGLSAAAFTRQHGLNYTTFSEGRRRQTKAPASPAFVQIEVATPSAPTELSLN